MFEIEEFVDNTKDKLSKIPYGKKDIVTSLLEVLPYLEGEDLNSMIEDINHIVKPDYIKQINSKNPLLSDISKDVEGVLGIGRLMVGDTCTGRCLVKINDFIQSVIMAEPGKGKTMLLFIMIRAILRYNETTDKKISVVMLDRKGDGRRGVELAVVLSLDVLGLVLFEAPPGCDQRKWISDVSQLLMSKWGFYYRSRNYFMSVVNNLYESKKRAPSMLEIYETIKEEQASNKRTSGRKLEIIETCLDRVENSLQEFGRCFSYKKTFPLWQFIEKGIPLVIEADISNDSFSLLLGWILLYIYRYRKSHDLRGNLSEGGTLVVCDEAYLLWEQARDFSEARRELGADFISVAPLFIRDFRTAILAVTQRPLSPDFMSTTNLKLVGALGDYEDMRYAANSLGDPELVKTISKLKDRQFIIKIGDKKPALLQTDDYQLQPIRDAELKERMQPFVDYIQEYCKIEEEQAPQEVRECVRLSRDAKVLLFDIVNYPDSTVSVRYKRLGFNGKRAQETVDEVVTSKYAEVVEEAIEGPKSAKYLVLTQSAIDWLKTQNVDVSHIQHIGKTGSLHALYQNILQVYLRRSGWTVKHDYAVGDKFVDVYAEKDRKVAFEVAVSDAVNKDRVASALGSVDEYVFLCRDLAVINSIRSQIGDQSGKIKYFVANQYITTLKSAVLDYYTYNNENNQNTKNKQNSGSFTSEQPENRSE